MAFEYYMDVWRNFADFSGRARRSEYWYFALFNVIIILTLAFMVEISMVFGFILGAYYLAVIIPSLSVVVRRLHDSGKSGWWFLVAFVPLVGSIIMLIFLCQDSEVDTNAWGPNPKVEFNDSGDHLIEHL